MICSVLITLPVFIFRLTGAEYCSSIFRFQEITHQRSLLTRRSRTRRARERQSVAALRTLSPSLSSRLSRSLPGNVYCVGGEKKKKKKKDTICARKPSKPPHLKSSFLQSPLCGDGNGTLNQCLAPSGFITRWQPHCGSSVMTTSGSERERGEQEKVRQMVRGDDNGAISQRILHLWRDGGCCRGLFDACWDECNGWTYLSLTASVSSPIEMSRHDRELWKQTLWGMSQLLLGEGKSSLKY